MRLSLNWSRGMKMTIELGQKLAAGETGPHDGQLAEDMLILPEGAWPALLGGPQDMRL